MIELFKKFYFFIALFVWLGIAFYMIRIIKLRKPGVNIWWDTLFNPLHLILMGSKLTESGLRARKKLLLLVIIFIAMVLIRRFSS